MKLHNLLLIATIILFFCGCGKEQSIQIPNSVEFDLDENGSTDIQFVYSKETEGVPSNPGLIEVIRGKLTTLNESQILTKEDESILFLENTDILGNLVTVPYGWDTLLDNSSNTVIIISQNHDAETWQEEWAIVNEEIKETYLIGFKLPNNDINRIGYIEISFDNISGEINLEEVVFL